MNLVKLLRSKKTVFMVDDLRKILDTPHEGSIRNYLYRAKKQGLVENIHYGIWSVTGREPNLYELACKLHKKAYISFETVLKKEGVIFQHYGSTIFLAGSQSIEKEALGNVFKSFKLKDEILLNPLGIDHMGNYSIASKERAICDRIYLSPGYHFDRLEEVDFEKLENISHIYNSRVIKEVAQLSKSYAG